MITDEDIFKPELTRGKVFLVKLPTCRASPDSCTLARSSRRTALTATPARLSTRKERFLGLYANAAGTPSGEGAGNAAGLKKTCTISPSSTPPPSNSDCAIPAARRGSPRPSQQPRRRTTKNERPGAGQRRGNPSADRNRSGHDLFRRGLSRRDGPAGHGAQRHGRSADAQRLVLRRRRRGRRQGGGQELHARRPTCTSSVSSGTWAAAMPAAKSAASRSRPRSSARSCWSG